MRNYNLYNLVDEKDCLGLKNGDLFLFNTDEPNSQKRVVGEILINKEKDRVPGFNAFMEFWPQFTPIANPSMVVLKAIKTIEQKEGYKVITLKKPIKWEAVSEEKVIDILSFYEGETEEKIKETFKRYNKEVDFEIRKK